MARYKNEEEPLPEVEEESEELREEKPGKVTIEEAILNLDRRLVAIEAVLFRLRSI